MTCRLAPVVLTLLLGVAAQATAQPTGQAAAQPATDPARPAEQAAAQAAEETAQPEGHTPTRPAEAQAQPTRQAAARPVRERTRPVFAGPRVGLSYRLYALRDARGGGLVQSVAFSGFLPTRYVRAGAGVEGGLRRYAYGPNDGILSGNVFIGYQHLSDLRPVVPYLVIVGELGMALQKRYHTPVVQLLRGAGVELGASVNLVRSLYVGVGLTFMLYTLDGLAYDTFGLRLSIGL